jgi:glycosyltransferase involved in cell wall biosynthesis
MAIDGISRELIEKADAGFFVEPENPADYAEKVRLYLNDTDLVSKQGENGYGYVKAHFDRQAIADRYLQFLSC